MEKPRREITAAELIRARATTLDEIIAEAIFAAIDATGGNMRLAARMLDISASTLYRRLDRISAASKKVRD